MWLVACGPQLIQCGIVNVALGPRRVEGAGVIGRQLRPRQEPLGQVGVGDPPARKGHQVGQAVGHGSSGLGAIEAAGRDERAAAHELEGGQALCPLLTCTHTHAHMPLSRNLCVMNICAEGVSGAGRAALQPRPADLANPVVFQVRMLVLTWQHYGRVVDWAPRDVQGGH